MANADVLRVKMALGGWRPQVFWWQGRRYRVLALEGMRTLGGERLYRLSTGQGNFELAVDPATACWRVRRSPGWLARLWNRWQNGARYPLPAWRRRGYRSAAAFPEKTGRKFPRESWAGSPCAGRLAPVVA
jgi:hypothetical protein